MDVFPGDTGFFLVLGPPLRPRDISGARNSVWKSAGLLTLLEDSRESRVQIPSGPSVSASEELPAVVLPRADTHGGTNLEVEGVRV